MASLKTRSKQTRSKKTRSKKTQSKRTQTMQTRTMQTRTKQARSKQSLNKQVAVIGAGAAGVIAAKYLLAEGFNVTVYERMIEIGGLWYSRDPMFRTNAYDTLETNVPRHLMTFAGQPWPASTPILAPKDTVVSYLDNIAHELKSRYGSRIQFKLRREVRHLRQILRSKRATWRLESRNPKAGKKVRNKISLYGAVVIATGNFSKEYFPPYEGLDEFKLRHGNRILHSKTYRNPGAFEDKRVLVIGNSANGWDISQQLVGVARSVTVSTRRPGQALSDSSHIRKGPIRKFLYDTRQIEFEDHTRSRFDKIIFCTGYKYHFSFVDNTPNQTFNEDFRVTNIYEHTFHIPQGGEPARTTNLAFVGLLKIVPWTVMEMQASLVAKVFAGRAKTPSTRDMKAWESKEIADWHLQCENDPALVRMFHTLIRGPLQHGMMGDNVTAYMDRLYDWIKRAPAQGSSRNVRLSPPFWCRRMDWIRNNTFQVRAAVLHAVAGRSEVDRLALFCINARLVDYNCNDREATCDCSGDDALCKTAFALDDHGEAQEG